MKIHEAAPMRRPINSEMEYGAVERVVAATAAALQKSNHETTVFALPETKLNVPVTVCGNLEIELQERYDAQAKAMLAAKGDVIHTHIYSTLIGLSNVLKIGDTHPPIFTTIHGPAEWTVHHHQEFIESLNIRVLALSKHHAEQLSKHFPVYGIVSNGVDADFYCPDKNSEKGDYIMTLGRISEEKGIDIAIQAAYKAGLRAIVAGPVLERSKGYFEKKIKPYMEAAQAEYVGPVNDAKKLKLIRAARALIQPSQIDETSSLTCREALACGTPVIASSRGALPEIVEDGVTGFIRDDVDGCVEALGRLDELSPETIRTKTINRYSWEATAKQLVEVFSSVL